MSIQIFANRFAKDDRNLISETFSESDSRINGDKRWIPRRGCIVTKIERKDRTQSVPESSNILQLRTKFDRFSETSIISRDKTRVKIRFHRAAMPREANSVHGAIDAAISVCGSFVAGQHGDCRFNRVRAM